jgi:hypothetical protein
VQKHWKWRVKSTKVQFNHFATLLLITNIFSTIALDDKSERRQRMKKKEMAAPAMQMQENLMGMFISHLSFPNFLRLSLVLFL